ncbi:thiolase family protein [Novosphingobium sp. Fuku2-ISO-50]|uniref:thiolase family protein n=1 Tax=Novosphingobium sp. Fuku2-ISO-50 TaxID=1739114 RepID=UPI00076C1C0D|nr:thiolase family protein [Novosphingobium sp. Fuku2-ISO-50]KUR73269.1 acetyl-CoA acetyltransferase [Novosphingobium sp. Fuku2-ISO-50]
MAQEWTLHVAPGAPNDPVFIGVGEIPTGKFPDRGFIQGLTKVALLALKDAGMAPRDIDTILLIPNLHGAADQADLVFSRMVEELGIHGSCKSSYMVHSGGSTSDNAVRAAHGLIATGHAQNVLVLQCERWGSADLSEMITMLSKNGIPGEWELPTGIQFNAIGAMITRRYMHASGSTPEEMASVCVTLRNWANRNENAMFYTKPLTVEQILASRMVADPLHSYECPPMADGACAFVMTNTANAKKRGITNAVRVAGSGGCVSHYCLSQEADQAVLGWPLAAERAWNQSGWGPGDADIAEIYDSYAAVTTIALEGIGIAAKGEGARWFAQGNGDPGGKLPINTNGGLLSAGHTGVGGGTALLVEGIRQLLHRAPAMRQVEGCQRAIIGGSGGSYMDAQILLLERTKLGA